ncbi:MAG TPA: BadF/BadG/BcrA/BcrD ATPase family protein [Rubrobacteraceae bacterium]|nr:BadF/BadG/BcrA/BcrD ATPase family protein [Rubrobacteraceae bacterium]
MSRHILIDGGQSGCRIVYVANGERVMVGAGAGLGRRDPDRTEGLLRVLESTFEDMAPRIPDTVDVVAAGLTGFDGSSEAARAIADGVRKRVRTARVVVTDDAVTSYLGAIGFEPGAVVAAGTGVIALAGDREGNVARSDGWGYILGDDGSGYYIGRRGLASALRSHDGRGGSEELLRRAKEVFGAPGSLKDQVYTSSNPAGEVAKFAREVAEAARGGDVAASEIWAIAAREVAQTATAALDQVFTPGTSVTVSWTGNLFEAGDLMLQPFQRQVAVMWPAARLLTPKGAALDGAELLARSHAPHMFEDLLHVFES